MGWDWLLPRFAPRRLPAMLAIAAVGAFLASAYGIFHDQITFSIGPEYFTRLKFQQFAWADFGWPPRVFAGVIGLLASWWVGMFGGWFIARAGADELPRGVRPAVIARAFALVAAVTIAGGFIGWVWGSLAATPSDLAGWQTARQILRIEDLPQFVIVAYIHNGTYLGAAIGVIAAVVHVRHVVRSLRERKLLCSARVSSPDAPGPKFGAGLPTTAFNMSVWWRVRAGL